MAGTDWQTEIPTTHGDPVTSYTRPPIGSLLRLNYPRNAYGPLGVVLTEVPADSYLLVLEHCKVSMWFSAACSGPTGVYHFLTPSVQPHLMWEEITRGDGTVPPRGRRRRHMCPWDPQEALDDEPTTIRDGKRLTPVASGGTK